MIVTDLDCDLHKQVASHRSKPKKSDRAQEESDLLDEGLLETFPASDPVSIYQPGRLPF